MKRKSVLLIIPVLLVAGIGGWFWWQGRTPHAEADRLTLYGNVDIREAQLTFNATEHVAEILVQEGDRVHSGQLLARLHTPLLEAQVAAAEALAAAQHQVVAELEAGSRIEEIDKARAELEAAMARATATRDTSRRMDRLLAKKVASQEEVEDARAEARVADSEAKAAERALALLLAGPRKEEIAAARAELKAREAELTLARQRLADAELFAPSDGVIRNRILEPGDMANPQKPAMTLAFIDPVWVRAYLPETLLGKVAPGMSAEILSDSYPDRRYPGWIGYISPTAEFTPKNVETPELRTRLVYSMRVYACNPLGELRLGMPTTVVVTLDPKPGEAAGENRCQSDG